MNMKTLGIHLGNWSCHVAYSDDIWMPKSVSEFKTPISQIKCLLGRKFSDPELQWELDYVPFRVIEGPNGYPLVHSRCKEEDRAFTPVEILAMLFSTPEFIPKNYCNSSTSTTGIPMYFTDEQKNDVLQAARIAGFPVTFSFLDETTATLVDALERNSSLEAKYIVAFVDIGHASMQVCFAEFEQECSARSFFASKWSVNILYKGYVRSLGGREFDKVLFKHFACKIRKEYNIDVSESSSASVRLREACEMLKYNLSIDNEACFSIEKLSGSVDVKGLITRKNFESLSISILEKIEVALKDALNESGLNVEKIDLVHPIGKGCSIPAIIDILTKVFGKKLETICYEDVAEGCALRAIRVHEITGTDKMINDLDPTALETSELVSRILNSEEKKVEDSSEKFLWRRAMHEKGHLMTFLNDFLEKNMHRIGRSKKTKMESYWLSKANYNFDEMQRKKPSLEREQLMFERDDARKHLEEAQKVTEQLMLERDDAKKLSETNQKLIEQLISERDDARELSMAAQKATKQLTSERDDARKLLEAAQKATKQLTLERDDARKLSKADQKIIEQLTSERDDARELSKEAHKLIEQLTSERDDARKLSEAAQKATKQLTSERDDARKLLEAAQKVTEQLMSERDDTRKLSEVAQKVTEQLMSERDDARKEVEELRLLTKLQAPGSQCVGYFRVYRYSELQVATNNFHESCKLGEGGFGVVYKGILHNTTMAIKMLKEGSRQGAKEFNQEIEILCKIQHTNLVTLIGACAENRAVIYEYIQNGSLEDRLRCKNDSPPLSWQARTRIAFEICDALSFLHCSKPHGIVHGDLKPDNILLDLSNVSKISDFGLCRELNTTDSASVPFHSTDIPKGTIGYMDPEYFSTAKITPQSDVYSFGIILLRLVTCKDPSGIRNLVEAAQQKGTLKALIDASAGPWPFKLAKKMISLGLRCSDPMRKNRPDLSTEVLKETKSMLQVVDSVSASSWATSLFRW